MKWLFFVLLLVNVALLFYVFRDSSVPAVPDSTLLTEVTPRRDDPSQSTEVQQLLAKARAMAKDATNDVKIIDSELVASPPKVDGQVGAVCLKVGPFLQTDDADHVLTELSGAGLKGDRQATEEKNNDSYWVYLPPFDSKESAVEASHKLAENGDTNNFVISAGTNINAISLGLYTDKQKAQARYEELVQKGYDPVLEVRPENKTSYWLNLRTESLAEAKAMQVVRDAVRNLIEIEVQRRGC